MKRIALFLATNLAIVLVLGILASIIVMWFLRQRLFMAHPPLKEHIAALQAVQ
ncbi:MAG: hypothetical protein Q8L56_01585 [Rhodocyclaceae bacterium]|nr:hypothetical protein [Rhodocyclaceae bacterium]